MNKSLSSLLPAPTNSEITYEEVTPLPLQTVQKEQPSKGSEIPPYGSRQSWRPTTLAHYADGGSYPECHIAQYPRDIGRRSVRQAQTLSLQVDSEGKVRYDAVALQGQRDGKVVQSRYRDLVPMMQRTDGIDTSMLRPSEQEVQANMNKTKEAFEKIVGAKIKAAQPKSVVVDTSGVSSYIRYTPSADPSKQRIIQMSSVVEDPLEPPKFKHKKVPRGPPSPPPPEMKSPPRRATQQEQQDWMIPPCTSNWKNNKGYTIPLAMRLAADGRGLQDVHINDGFAKFSEALMLADRHVREEVKQRNIMQQRLAQKEKASQEESLRLMAQRAREERSGIMPAKPAGPLVGGYGSSSDSESDSDDNATTNELPGDADSGAKERDAIRRERRVERERELRLSHMGQEQRAKQLMRQQNRDISEKVALGLAKPSALANQVDSRLFNRDTYAGSFGEDDSYNLYDKPLFVAAEAAAAIYRPQNNDGDSELLGNGTEEGVKGAMANDRFGLGVSNAFDGTDGPQVEREGPVKFEKEVTADPFGIDSFLSEAAKSAKRGLDTSTAESRKKSRVTDQDQ